MGWDQLAKAAGGALLLKVLHDATTIPCLCGKRRDPGSMEPCSRCGCTLLELAAAHDRYLRGLRPARLERWTNLGARTTSKSAYHDVKDHLDRALSEAFPGWEIDLFLQGSYRNWTTIYGDSDVDVVASLGFPVWWVNGEVTTHQAAPRMDASPKEVWSAFHQEVLNAVQGRFGWFHTNDGRRAIKVGDRAAHRRTDVLVSLEARLRFEGQDTVYSGITFPDGRSGEWMINFPRRHFKNGARKNEDCGGNFRRTVRMFKNARTTAGVEDDSAPGYFISCLLYNAPASLFSRDEERTFFRCLRWLSKRLHEGDGSGFVCQHGLFPLFGSRPEQWDLEDARRYLQACRELWFEGA